VAQGGPSPAGANRTRVERDARERLALRVTMAAHVTSARDATRRIDHLIGAAQVLSVSEDSAARTPSEGDTGTWRSGGTTIEVLD